MHNRVKPNRIIFSVAVVIACIACPLSYAAELKPFASDGCSAFPEGTLKQKQLWAACCTLHDYAYWKGGTYTERKQADEALESCVAQVGEPEIAKLMLAGVRVGGSPFWPTSFRWGYGWPYPRFYGVLSQEELLEVRRFSDLLDIDLTLE